MYIVLDPFHPQNTRIKLLITDPICSLARFCVAYISYFLNLHKTPAQYICAPFWQPT